jgi:hypothetical protein
MVRQQLVHDAVIVGIDQHYFGVFLPGTDFSLLSLTHICHIWADWDACVYPFHFW